MRGCEGVRRLGRRLIVAASALVMSAMPGAGQAGDFALVNGHVFTDAGWRSAVAVSGDRIAAVGSDAAVRRALPKGATVVDLKGRTVFPGLFDVHVHPGYAGRYLHPCSFTADADVDAMAAAVRACVGRARPGEWIYGGSWKQGPAVAAFRKEVLDRVAPLNPVVLIDVSGHNVWANSLAMTVAGFTRGVPDPKGGSIARDATGEPTGVLLEAPASRLRYSMPAPSPEAATRNVADALAELARKGITSLVDAGVRMEDANAYASLLQARQLQQQVRGCILWNKDSPDFAAIFADRARRSTGAFRLDCVKVFMDGVPNESHSAAMLAPYEHKGGAHGTEPVSGALEVDPAELRARMIEWDALGLVVKFHCGGDRAVQAAMDAVAAARAANGSKGPIHEIAHVTFAATADLARAKSLGVVLEFSPIYWYPHPLSEEIARAAGPQRAAHIWPVRSALAAGALVVAASDWPGAEDPNPWLAIETLVTRRAPGNRGDTLAASEAISLPQAVDLYTRSAAKTFGDPRRRGTIERGMAADLIVLDRNPFETPIGQVHAIRTLRTIVDGETIFDDGTLD
jgi:predicted amidohydrolase YtcJ